MGHVTLSQQDSERVILGNFYGIFCTSGQK